MKIRKEKHSVPIVGALFGILAALVIAVSMFATGAGADTETVILSTPLQGQTGDPGTPVTLAQATVPSSYTTDCTLLFRSTNNESRNPNVHLTLISGDQRMVVKDVERLEIGKDVSIEFYKGSVKTDITVKATSTTVLEFPFTGMQLLGSTVTLSATIGDSRWLSIAADLVMRCPPPPTTTVAPTTTVVPTTAPPQTDAPTTTLVPPDTTVPQTEPAVVESSSTLPPPPPTTATPTLPATGSNTGWVVNLAIVLMVVGSLLVIMAVRRRRRPA